MTSIFDLQPRIVRPLSSPTYRNHDPAEQDQERAEINRIQQVKYRKPGSGRKSTLDKRCNVILQYLQSNATEHKPLSREDLCRATKKDRTMTSYTLKYLRENAAVQFTRNGNGYLYWIAL